MKIPFTLQLLGDLIEKGYTYVLANTTVDAADKTTITLTPVRQKPDLSTLPEGFETYYRITREPMMMAAGLDGQTVVVEYQTMDLEVNSEDFFDDSYFRMSEDFFEQVLDSLEDYAVFTTDKAGNVNSWNSGAQKLLGYDKAEIIGENGRIFFTPEDVANKVPEEELGTAIANSRAIDERYHVRKGGSKFWGTGLVFPLFDEEKNHRGFTKIMRNLREEEHARALADK